MEDRSLKMDTLRGKRFFFILTRLELGGAERQSFLLAQHLKQYYGADVRVFGLQGEQGCLAEMCKEAGIPCNSLKLGSMRSRLEWIRALLRFAWFMRRGKPDLLISYTKKANIFSALAWRVSGAIGCIWNQADEGLGMQRELASRLAVSLAPCFISNSLGGRSFLQSSFGIPDSRVTVIHNGISLLPSFTTRKEWRKSNGISDDEYVVCMVANLSRFKDQATLLRAWKQVLHLAAPQRPILLLAGRFDGTERDLVTIVDELELGDRVRFLGCVTDISGLLGAVDLFAFSSRSEGLPNSVVEAMAAGLPVVGTDIPGIREALGPDGISFLAPPSDSECLAQKIFGLMTEPGLSQEYGGKLRCRAAKEFALSMMLEQSVQIIAGFFTQLSMSE